MSSAVERLVPAALGSLLLVAACVPASGYEAASTGRPSEYLKWGASNQAGTPGGIVTWGLVAAGTPGSPYCGIYCVGRSSDVLPNFYVNPEHSNATTPVALASLQPVFQSAFDAWSSAADIEFRYSGIDGSRRPINDPRATSPMIRISAFPFGGLVAFFCAGASFAPPPNGGTGAGDVFSNTNVGYQLAAAAEGTRLPDFPAGGGLHMTDLHDLALHEIGHAIGLADSSDPEAVMYGGEGSAALIPAFKRRGLAADDIAGARFLYGAPRNRPGNAPAR